MVFLIPKTDLLPTLAIEEKKRINGFYLGHTNFIWALYIHLYNTNLSIFYYVKLLMIDLGYSDEQ